MESTGSAARRRAAEPVLKGEFRLFRFLTGGESHGPSLSAVIEGLPAGLEVDFDEVNRQLRRRQGGYGRGDRQKVETEVAEFSCGVRLGRTLGSAITLIVRNRDVQYW